MYVSHPESIARKEMQKKPLTAAFNRQFRWLILLTWIVPAIFGMGFLLFIRIFTPEQILQIQLQPLEPLFVLAYVLGSYIYFTRYVRPVSRWLENSSEIDAALVLNCIQGFSVRYWAVFLSYLLLAPTVVINAAETYSDFVATPVDWFRIHLVSLIVSIIVGLPIFFLIFDLFGRAIGRLDLLRPIVAIKTKVFLIGALVPLLIDTMLVQYYWTRTGYFTIETFGVWLLLELLAIAGSLIFVRSFGQSLLPLQKFIGAPRPIPAPDIINLHGNSTDELGLLTADYQKLLVELQSHNEILQLKNELLRRTGAEYDLGDVFTAIVDFCRQAINSDQAFLVMHDATSNELISVAQSADGYKAKGHFRLPLDEISLASWVFKHRETVMIENADLDTRVSREMCERFGVRAALSTPLWMEGGPQGVLMLVDRKSRRYSTHERMLIEGVAREVAMVLESQDLRAQRREQAEQIRLLMDAMEEGIYGLDTNGLCTFINPAALRMLGYQASEDLLGRNLHELIHHSHADGLPYPMTQCRVRIAMQAGGTVHADDELHWRSDGTSFPIEYWSRPINRDGHTVGAVVSFVDISIRKSAEEELTRYREQLETLVRTRTAELEFVNQELEAFSYSVSHDLRAPLRAVDGFAQALAEDYESALDANGQDYLLRIRNGAQRMGVLIDDLLQLSRVTRSEVCKVEVCLSDLAAEIVNQLAAADPERQVTVVIMPGMTAAGDVQMLLIALTNLFDNAWKYTSRTEHATVEFAQAQQQGNTVFYIRDNGTGFDMRYAGKLFSAFQRLHGSEFPGTGIGLATVQRIVHRHGGRVWAEAEPGVGATFYFTLLGS